MIQFLAELAENNDREWFHANKARYEIAVKEPFESFVENLIAKLQKLDPNLQCTAKEAIFRTILRHAEPDPAKVLVVGDRPASEIRAGKALGMHTVRLRHGEFVSQEPAGPEERPDHEIRKIEVEQTWLGGRQVYARR